MGLMGTYFSRARLQTEESSIANSAAANDTVIGANSRRYTYITLPTTWDLYLLTGFEWSNGTVVNGNCTAGVEYVDAIPPVDADAMLCSWGTVVAQTGASAVQRTSSIRPTIVKGGTILGCFFATASATGRYLTATVSSRNNTKAIAPTTDFITGSGATAWGASTEEPYFKLYYQGLI